MSLITLIIIAVSAFIGGYNGSTPEAPKQAMEQAVEAPIQAPQSAPVAPRVVSVEQAQTWATFMLEQADMELPPTTALIFSNTSNCGAEISTAGLGGCTYTLEDGSHAVILSPELAWTQWGTHILFHELAHTVGMGECEAEAYAHQFEEIELWSYPLCEETGKP